MNDSNGGVKGTVINKSTSIVINSMQKKRSQGNQTQRAFLKRGRWRKASQRRWCLSRDLKPVRKETIGNLGSRLSEQGTAARRPWGGNILGTPGTARRHADPGCQVREGELWGEGQVTQGLVTSAVTFQQVLACL